MSTPDPPFGKPDESSPEPPFIKLGTLPETIGEADLGTLNSALGVLFGRLLEARAQFVKEGGNGRLGPSNALGACWTFITLFGAPLAENLHVPLLRLQDALAMLDQGRTDPMLKPVKRRGGAVSDERHNGLKGHVAATVQLLQQIGLTRYDAHQAVAKLLRPLGVQPERGSGTVTATTVRNWCNVVSSDVGRHGMAVRMYDYKLFHGQRMLSAPKAQARQSVLQELAGWVEVVFPRPQKAS
jgi:hypothetical protein